MKVDFSQHIQLSPNDNSETASLKTIAQKALFAAPANSMTRDDAFRLYDMVSKSSGELSIEADDVAKIKNVVDQTYMRGISWQFAKAIDPVDDNHKTNKK